MMPTTSQFDELEFHIRELRYDVAETMRELAALSPHVAAGDARRLCAGLASICASIEHDCTEHGAKALKLARSEPFAPDPDVESEVASEERWAEVEKPTPGLEATPVMLRRLRSEMEELTARLQEATESVARVEALRQRKDPELSAVASLLERVHEILGKALAPAFRAMRLAKCVDRTLNPESPEESDE
jgi:hypothetical protein